MVSIRPSKSIRGYSTIGFFLAFQQFLDQLRELVGLDAAHDFIIHGDDRRL
jgi:hypothetical protein